MGQEYHGSFHHPYHEPYQQPSYPPQPPYISYFEPSLPPYNSYHGPHSQPCVPNPEPTISEVIREFQYPMTQTINDERSHKDAFAYHIASLMRTMEQQDEERVRLAKDIEHLTQPSQETKRLDEELEKAMEWLYQKPSKCNIVQETHLLFPICEPTTQGRKVKKVRFQTFNDYFHTSTRSEPSTKEH